MQEIEQEKKIIIVDRSDLVKHFKIGDKIGIHTLKHAVSKIASKANLVFYRTEDNRLIVLRDRYGRFLKPEM